MAPRQSQRTDYHSVRINTLAKPRFVEAEDHHGSVGGNQWLYFNMVWFEGQGLAGLWT